MFEQEVEMEKHQSSVVPLLLIVTLIVAIVGIAGYYLIENRKVLSQQEATSVATAVLNSQGPATVSFHTGVLKASVNDSAQNPQYRLLEKSGYLKVGKAKDYKTPVDLTPKGEELVKETQATKTSEKDGTESYVVPLATRKLVAVTNIKMLAAGRAAVDITWQWDPNELGDLFDAAGPTLKTFSSWDRMALIQKHGADFFHGAPTKVTLLMMKDNGTWKIQTGD